jgi:hypothetical protein
MKQNDEKNNKNKCEKKRNENLKKISKKSQKNLKKKKFRTKISNPI